MTAPHIVDPSGLLGEALAEASPDLMRSLLQDVINALLSADADAVVGAEYGRPSSDRVSQRNGYRHRGLDTRVGTIDVTVAVEDCRHLTRRLEADLLEAGHRVVRVHTRLMAGMRRSSRERGKSDPIDAEAVARVALREEGLPTAELRVRPGTSSSCQTIAGLWSPGAQRCSPRLVGSSTKSILSWRFRLVLCADTTSWTS